MKRVVIAIVAVVLLLPLVAVAAIALLIDSDAVKSRAADAVRRSTGRELVIAGPIGLTWSLAPTIALRDVSLSNPPGMSRPAMAQIRQIEAQVDLIPLLSRRVEVRSVTLVEPDILLERDAAGRPNWLFTPEATTPQATPSPGSTPSPPMTIAVDAVRIRDARVGYGAAIARVPAMTLDAAGPGGPVTVSGSLLLAGATFDLRGTTGPLAMAGTPGWPVQASLDGAGLRVAANTAPEGLALSAGLADLSVLGTALGQALPPVRDLKGVALVGPGGLGSIEFQAGAADLSAYLPGLQLVRGRVTAPAPTAPVSLTIEGLSGPTPVAFAANAGTLSSLLGTGPVAFQLRLLAAGADLAGEGTVADLSGTGLDMAVTARVPDLAGLGALAGQTLPPIRNVALDARASITPTGAVALRALRLVTPLGDVAGDVVVGRLPRPSVRGTLVSQRLNLDAFPAAPAPVAAPAPPASTPASTPAPAAPPPLARVFSDAPLPFGSLRRMDADLRLSVNEAVWRGASVRALEGRALLQDGQLRLDPMQGQAPGGTLQMLLLADAGASSVAFGLRAPGLAAGPLLGLFGAPDGTTGRIDADLQLNGEGATPRAIATTLDGYVGLAMVEGELDNRWLAGLLGNALRSVPVDMGGRSKVRCLALRLDMADGQATARALLLDATRLRLEGDGGVNLADETLDMRVRALVRLGPTSVTAPVHLSGPWRAPRAQVAGSGGSVVIGAPAAPDACPAQLALARNGRPGPPPSAIETLPAPRPADILRGLLR